MKIFVKNLWRGIWVFIATLLADLLKDRYIGAINRWLDGHAPGLIIAFISWIVNRPFILTSVAFVVFVSAIAIHAVVVSRATKVRERDIGQEKPKTQLTEHAEDSVNQTGAILGERDPCILPRYQKSASAVTGINNSDWFVLHNDGKTEAYDVSIETFHCGDTVLTFAKIPLIKANEFGIAKAELSDLRYGKVPNYGIAVAFQAGWSFDKAATDGLIFRQDTSVTYRDRANQWFRTQFTMAYNIRKDFIEIENIRHSKSSRAS